jgi:hypothetical protein
MRNGARPLLLLIGPVQSSAVEGANLRASGWPNVRVLKRAVQLESSLLAHFLDVATRRFGSIAGKLPSSDELL